MSDKIAISTAKAPPPAATYNQGVCKGGLVQVAGPRTTVFVGLAESMLVEIDALAVVD